MPPVEATASTAAAKAGVYADREMHLMGYKDAEPGRNLPHHEKMVDRDH